MGPYICLSRICCLALDVVSLFVSRLLPSNGSAHYSIKIHQFMVEEIIFSALKMKAAGSSKLLVPVYQATRCHPRRPLNDADLYICYSLWNQELHRAKTWDRGPSLFRVLARCFGVNAMWLGLTMAFCEFFR
jgi:hypothetical protein